MAGKQEAKEAALKKALQVINKKNPTASGDPLVGTFGMSIADIERFSSGSLVLDALLGGGIPKGRVVEIFGPEASGKTSIALTAVGNVQKDGGIAAFIDLENALDPYYAETLGVDMEKLVFAQPEHGEQALGLVENLIDSGLVDLIVVDSVAALITQGEMEGNVGDITVATKARLLSKFLPKILGKLNRNNTTVIFINQIRDAIGKFSPMGTPETTTGGKSLPFYASQRVRVARSGQIKEGSEIIGTEVKLNIKKNKTGRPYLIDETVLSFANGIDRAAELIQVGHKYGTIERPNSRTYVEAATGEVIGNSKANAVARLKEDSELFERVSKQFNKDVINAIQNKSEKLKVEKPSEDEIVEQGE